ncbi:MAG: hypothetical protein IJT59_04255 [Desulfovibrionaceae bacterium]|nr:hypothetical protein [Desulfovibrionaceae bacterium]
MSLTNNCQSLREGAHKIRSPGERETLNQIDSYLAVLEDNRTAARFLSTDMSLALDMANFVCERLHGREERRFIPAARLSLSLVQSTADGPIQ